MDTKLETVEGLEKVDNGEFGVQVKFNVNGFTFSLVAGHKLFAASRFKHDGVFNFWEMACWQQEQDAPHGNTKRKFLPVPHFSDHFVGGVHTNVPRENIIEWLACMGLKIDGRKVRGMGLV